MIIIDTSAKLSVKITILKTEKDILSGEYFHYWDKSVEWLRAFTS